MSMEDQLQDQRSEGSLLPDTAGIPHVARRVLVTLLRHGVILSSKKPLLYEALCRHQDIIRERLRDLYLRLVLDERAGVSFVAAQENDEEDPESNESISLIHRRVLTLYDTLLLLVLRKYYQEREKTGEQKIVVDFERVEMQLLPFLPLTNHESKDKSKLRSTLKKMDEKHLVIYREGEDRFEITPIIKYVVDAEFLENLLAEYAELANTHAIQLPDLGKEHE